MNSGHFAFRRCGPEDLEALLPLVGAYHAFEEIAETDEARRSAVLPLLEDPSLGGIWGAFGATGLEGYLALTFGYSIEFGGRDAFVDEFFLAPEIRAQGIGGRLLEAAAEAAKAAGIGALHLEVERRNGRAQDFYRARGFALRDRFRLMSRRLA